jgi:hypothetical protein
LLKTYGPGWSDDPSLALVALVISLGTGVLFYNPALLMSLLGFRPWYDSERAFSLAVAAAATVFVLFISWLTFFKGDPTWGPRYLTPIFAVLWIFAPAGSLRARRWVIYAALRLGLLLQLGALSIDPLRLQVERASAFKTYDVTVAETCFYPSSSHLVQRSREIVEVLATSGETARYKSSRPVIDVGITVGPLADVGPAAIRKNHVLNSFRPWWASLSYLDGHLAQISIPRSLVTLSLIAMTGIVLLAVGVRPSGRADFSSDFRCVYPCL